MTYWLILFDVNPRHPGAGPMKLKISRLKYEYFLTLEAADLEVPGEGNFNTLNRRVFSMFDKAAFIVCDVKRNVQQLPESKTTDHE